jgi:outer membrane immunogenic protein
VNQLLTNKINYNKENMGRDMTNKKLILAATLACLPAISFADDAGPTVALQFGSHLIDLDSAENGKTIGLNLGYDFGNSFAVEYQTNAGHWGLGNDDGEIKTQALYGVYRSQGDLYFLVKLGALKEEVSLEHATEDDTGASYGLGGGKKISDYFMMEAEITLVDENVNVIALGSRIKF